VFTVLFLYSVNIYLHILHQPFLTSFLKLNLSMLKRDNYNKLDFQQMDREHV
jgi:hypothetical protein